MPRDGKPLGVEPGCRLGAKVPPGHGEGGQISRLSGGTMHREFRTIFFALAILALPTPFAAAAAPAPLVTLSFGGDSCGRFVQALPADQSMYVAWTLGFISGANLYDIGKGKLAGLHWDQAGVTVWLTNYCQNNPLNVFAQAAEKLREAFGGNPPRP